MGTRADFRNYDHTDTPGRLTLTQVKQLYRPRKDLDARAFIRAVEAAGIYAYARQNKTRTASQRIDAAERIESKASELAHLVNGDFGGAPEIGHLFNNAVSDPKRNLSSLNLGRGWPDLQHALFLLDEAAQEFRLGREVERETATPSRQQFATQVARNFGLVREDAPSSYLSHDRASASAFVQFLQVACSIFEQRKVSAHAAQYAAQVALGER